MLPIEGWVFDNTNVRWVCGGGGDAPFAYTAGYWSVGLPELVVVGLSDRQSATLLNTCGARQKERGTGWVPGEIDTELFTLPTKFGSVADRWVIENMSMALTRVAITLHDKPHGVVQVLWPDTKGNFPGDPGYEQRFIDQKVLA